MQHCPIAHILSQNKKALKTRAFVLNCGAKGSRTPDLLTASQAL